MNQSTKFLTTIGLQVNNVKELIEQDIVGHANDDRTVRFYCVRAIEDSFLKLRAFFMPPHVGIVLKDGLPFRHYIHTPMPGESYKYSWAVWDEKEIHQHDEVLADIAKDENFPLFRITNSNYIKLGSLIPKVVVPSWGIMCQTHPMDGEDPIYKFVDSIQEDLKQASIIYERIRSKTYYR